MGSEKRSSKPKRPWQDVAKDAQLYRDQTVALVNPSLPALPDPLPKNVTGIPTQFLTRAELHITSLSVNDLLDALAGRGSGRRLSAVEVVNAFLRRAALAQKLFLSKTNCITELLHDRAIERAQYLDVYFEQHGKPIGPFHGLPISVKEHIGMKGLRMHASFVALWDQIATEDAHVLQILEAAGAIFHARTTEPQTMMHLETSSNLYGVTVNPYNSDLSCGGSSGGEGALIGLGGSCLGLGSDVGGSVRSPAANNGIYSLRPSYFRVPTDGWSSIAANVDEIPTVIGPLSRDIDGLELFMRTIALAKPHLTEPALLPLPWTPYHVNPSTTKPLKIAIMWHDNIVLPHPPITRALRTLSTKLSTLPNITVSRWHPHLHDEAWAITSSLYYPDGGASDLSLLDAAAEPILPLTKWIIQDNPCVKHLDMEQLQYWKEEREAYRKEYATIWNATGTNSDDGECVDVVICPVGPGLAPKHEMARYWSYTSQWNLLDYPAAVFPVGKAHAGVDRKEREEKMMSELDRENWDLYDEETFDGVPVCLQIVGRRYEDEKVVGVLRYLQEKLQFPFESLP